MADLRAALQWRDMANTLTQVITAKPELSYTSVLSTIRCFAVTSGDAEGSTYVEWTGNFSSDADAGTCTSRPSLAPSLHLRPRNANTSLVTGVIQDAKFKRREALGELAKAASKK